MEMDLSARAVIDRLRERGSINAGQANRLTTAVFGAGRRDHPLRGSALAASSSQHGGGAYSTDNGRWDSAPVSFSDCNPVVGWGWNRGPDPKLGAGGFACARSARHFAFADL